MNTSVRFALAAFGYCLVGGLSSCAVPVDRSTWVEASGMVNLPKWVCHYTGRDGRYHPDGDPWVDNVSAVIPNTREAQRSLSQCAWNLRDKQNAADFNHVIGQCLRQSGIAVEDKKIRFNNQHTCGPLRYD